MVTRRDATLARGMSSAGSTTAGRTRRLRAVAAARKRQLHVWEEGEEVGKDEEKKNKKEEERRRKHVWGITISTNPMNPSICLSTLACIKT